MIVYLPVRILRNDNVAWRRHTNVPADFKLPCCPGRLHQTACLNDEGARALKDMIQLL